MSESTDLSALKARLEDVEARQAILDAEKKCHSRGDPEGMLLEDAISVYISVA